MEISNEHRLTLVEDRSAANTRRIEDLERRQDDLDKLVGTVQALAVKEERVESDVKEIKSDVKALVGKSGRRWDGLVDKVILTVAATIVGFLLSRIGII